MDILTSLALLKRLLDEVPRLKRLASNPQNEELPAWDNEVRRILVETFGTDSKEFSRYDGIVLLKSVKTQADKEHAYIDHVSQREKALKDIIKEHDLPVKVGAQDNGRGNIKDELKHFYEGFIRYKELVIAKNRGSLKSEQESEFQDLSAQLQRSYGSLKKVIEKYGGPSVLLLEGGNYKCEAFSSAFNYTLFSPGTLVAVMDAAITTLNMAIGNLEKLLKSEQLPREAIFQNGKQYDAYEAIKDIITTATKKLIIVDTWVDGTLFHLLGNAQPNVQIQILTQNMIGDFMLAGQKFKKQREKGQQGTLTVHKSSKFHDRFIVVDDKIFHLGASIKDAGDKMFAMSEIEGPDIKSKLSETISSYWDKAEIVL